MLLDFWQAVIETALMMGIAVIFAAIVGVPLGIGLFVTNKGMFWLNKYVQNIAGTAIYIIRSIPNIVLVVRLLPITYAISGTATCPVAACVSLPIAAIPFYARLVESSLPEIDKGVIEAAESCGASPWLIIKDVLLAEARSSMISGLTVTVISTLGYSAMAGMVGGGGIGDLAIRFGYYRFQTEVMFTTVIILIILVQFIQYMGDRTAKAVDRR